MQCSKIGRLPAQWFTFKSQSGLCSAKALEGRASPAARARQAAFKPNIRQLVAAPVMATSLFLGLQAQAIDMQYLQGQMPMAKNAITPYGDDMFGDKVSLFDGSLSFEQTDLALKGNNALPVALTRGANPGKHEGPASFGNAVGDWAWKVPRIGGTFATTSGWRGSDGSTARCSKYWFPAVETVSFPQSGTLAVVDLDPTKFWHGTSLDVPGQGGGELLLRDPAYTAAPQNGGFPAAPATSNPASPVSFPLVTKSQWQIGCLSTIQNDAGEGFYAISPTGVRYDFNWMSIRSDRKSVV